MPFSGSGGHPARRRAAASRPAEIEYDVKLCRFAKYRLDYPCGSVRSPSLSPGLIFYPPEEHFRVPKVKN